jgi:hypothetical protein
MSFYTTNNNVLNSEEKVFVYPGTGTFSGILDILHSIGDYILKGFPNNFIRSSFYDTKDSFINQYLTVKVGKLKGQNLQFTKQERPRLIITFDHRSNDSKETGLGEVNPFQYPMQGGLYKDMQGYIKFYQDSNNVYLFTSDKRVKVSLEIVIETESAQDQENVLAYMENRLKVLYGSRLTGIKAGFIMPNEMLENMKSILYADQLKIAHEESNPVLRKELYEEIHRSFNNTLIKGSAGGIIPKLKGEKDNNYYYIYERIYNKIYFEVTDKPNKSDGEKKGEVYDKYSVLCSAFFEFYKPISYLLKTPSVVGGHLVNEAVVLGKQRDKDLNYTPAGIISRKPTNFTYPVVVNNYLNTKEVKILLVEHEITVEEPKDSINILEWLKEQPEKYDPFIKVMENIDDKKWKTMFKVFVLEDYDTSLDEIMVKENIVYMNGTDSSKLYSIYILYNPEVVKFELRNIYINS